MDSDSLLDSWVRTHYDTNNNTFYTPLHVILYFFFDLKQEQTELNSGSIWLLCPINDTKSICFFFILLLLLIALLSVLLFLLFYPACDPGWIAYGSSCYQAHSTQKTWANAQAECASKTTPSHLVVLNDVAEERFVFDTLLPWRMYGPVWLGCNDAEADDTPPGAGEDMWTCLDSSQSFYNNNTQDQRGYWSK